ncbi:MAG: hypothetical protein Q8O25_00010 [Sulfurisoma sp.]|nr:hypothetical protein [Sulfurisoma sp.]
MAGRRPIKSHPDHLLDGQLHLKQQTIVARVRDGEQLQECGAEDAVICAAKRFFWNGNIGNGEDRFISRALSGNAPGFGNGVGTANSELSKTLMALGVRGSF